MSWRIVALLGSEPKAALFETKSFNSPDADVMVVSSNSHSTLSFRRTLTPPSRDMPAFCGFCCFPMIVTFWIVTNLSAVATQVEIAKNSDASLRTAAVQLSMVFCL